MLKKPKLIYASILVALFFCSFINYYKTQLENQSPVVKIISPQNNTTFGPNTIITYKITVSDKEDGESKYDEINVKEVLLEVRHLQKGSKAPAKVTQDDPPGLAAMRTSNCFNCHNFNSKLIGPSFYEMSKRYPVTKSNTDSLSKRIREGSSGIWPGREKMPAHPELKAEEIKNMVQWILKNGADPEVTYYVGVEGSFHVDANQKGSYRLTASYIDHGLKNNPAAKHLKGQDVLLINVK
jgi:cytochrome c